MDVIYIIEMDHSGTWLIAPAEYRTAVSPIHYSICLAEEHLNKYVANYGSIHKFRIATFTRGTI